ncbi:hypothetical protein [Spartinivicinus ruber]|uniref:hypothetical protein n=1 Tax=Spartinivicinus ruber TaxID=2683272 RepID=UPI0013D47B34|nr:hypothetical protein [Spartinivicinus ruber]
MLKINQYGRSPIARKLLFITVSVSTLIALIITLIQLAHDYYQDIKRIETTIEQIRITNVPSLVVSLWDVDHIQTGIQLKSLMKIPEVKFVQVIPHQTSPISYGDNLEKGFFVKNYSFKLAKKSKNDSTETDLGILNVTYNLKSIYIKLAEKLGLIFFLNCLKTLTVSFIILFVFWKLVTSHLINITEQLNQHRRLITDSDDSIISDPDSQGEISSLVKSINKLYSYLKENKTSKNLNDEDAIVSTEFLADYCLVQSANEKNMSRSLIIRLNGEITKLLTEFEDSKKKQPDN